MIAQPFLVICDEPGCGAMVIVPGFKGLESFEVNPPEGWTESGGLVVGAGAEGPVHRCPGCAGKK